MKIKYEKMNIFPYGEVLVPEVEGSGKSLIEGYVTSKKEESGWLTKAIVDKIKNYSKRKIKLINLLVKTCHYFCCVC
jgi:hypothetical protein